jgi:solute carrier family 25 citrate transporter 1
MPDSSNATEYPAYIPGLLDLRHREESINVIHRPRHSGSTDDAPVPTIGQHGKERTKASPALKALAGSMGGLVEAVTLQPVDTIKTRMQLHPTLYPSMVQTATRITAEESVPALWKGLTPFATHLFSKYALRFGTNATFQSLLTEKETGM